MDNSNVKEFRIWAHIGIDPESIAKIIKYNSSLSTISFRMTNLASAGESLISALKLNTSLKKIALQGDRTGIVSITQGLKKNFSLRNITFWSLDSKDEQLVKDLIESAKNNKIEKLGVVYSKIVGDLLRELLAVESFKSLKLVSCTLRSDEIRIIGEKLKTNRNLTHLDLSCNTISSQDMPYLVEALKFNKTLTRLNLTECEIQSESAQYFAEILRTNSTLQDLNLDNNLFDSIALKTIGDALSTNKTLLRLYIRHEKIGNVLPAFTEALKVNKSLEYLFLVYDPDDFKSVNDFSEVMKNNTALRELIVRGVQRGYLTTEPNQQIVQLFSNIFTTNKALTKFKVQIPIGLHIQQRFNNFTDENERQQVQFKNDTKILMHNIVKSSSARQLLPIEIWRQIFSQLDYPGIKSLKAMADAICK
jgi:GGDEF domain-containing protein